jgi:hypothetical protein
VPNSQEKLLTTGPSLVAELLQRHDHVRVRALGGSMFSAIRSGDILDIHYCTPDDVKPGDVVVRFDADRLFAHRVLSTSGGNCGSFVVTRGDAHWRRDPAWPASQLVGQVTAITRHGCTQRTPAYPTRVQRACGLAVRACSQLWQRAKICMPRKGQPSAAC